MEQEPGPGGARGGNLPRGTESPPEQTWESRGMEDPEQEQLGRGGEGHRRQNENESPNYWVGVLAAGFQGTLPSPIICQNALAGRPKET